MADPTPYPDTNDDASVGPDRGSATGTPRWVKVFGIIALALVLLLAIMILTGGHGPGRHMSAGLGGHTPPSSVKEHGVPQP